MQILLTHYFHYVELPLLYVIKTFQFHNRSLPYVRLYDRPHHVNEQKFRLSHFDYTDFYFLKWFVAFERQLTHDSKLEAPYHHVHLLYTHEHYEDRSQNILLTCNGNVQNQALYLNQLRVLSATQILSKLHMLKCPLDLLQLRKYHRIRLI